MFTNQNNTFCSFFEIYQKKINDKEMETQKQKKELCMLLNVIEH